MSRPLQTGAGVPESETAFDGCFRCLPVCLCYSNIPLCLALEQLSSQISELPERWGRAAGWPTGRRAFLSGSRVELSGPRMENAVKTNGRMSSDNVNLLRGQLRTAVYALRRASTDTFSPRASCLREPLVMQLSTYASGAAIHFAFSTTPSHT